MKAITKEQLAELLDYCEETGVFTWKSAHHWRAKPGMVAGNIDPSHGYCKIGVLGANYYAHRLAWLVVHGEFPNEQVDHIDGNRTNNAIKNLRLATQSENNQNLRAPRGDRKGQLLGVYRTESGRWRAAIRINKKSIHLGNFDTQEGAYEAYLKAKRKLHPFQTIAN